MHTLVIQPATLTWLQNVEAPMMQRQMTLQIGAAWPFDISLQLTYSHHVAGTSGAEPDELADC